MVGLRVECADKHRASSHLPAVSLGKTYFSPFKHSHTAQRFGSKFAFCLPEYMTNIHSAVSLLGQTIK